MRFFSDKPKAVFYGFAFFVCVSTCLGIFIYYHPIPFQDHWYSLRFFDEYLNGGLTLKSLWAQHNEHRIIFPALMFLVDYLLVHGTGTFLIASILLLQGFHAALLGWAIPRRSGFSGIEKTILGSAAWVFSFWLIQSENLNSPHQISFLMGGFFASLAAFLICRWENPMQGKPVYATVPWAALCVVISTYSLANGALMWILLPLIGWKSGFKGKPLFLWALIGMVVMASYLIGYQSPPDQSSPWDAWHWKTLHYLLAFLGNPLTPRSVWAGTVLGMAGLAACLWFAGKFCREKNPEFSKKFGMALALYSSGTGVLTAMGRQQSGVLQSTCSRYQTTALLFWFSLLLLTYAWYGKVPKVTRWIRIGMAGLFFGAVLPTQLMALGRGLKIQYLKSDEASLGLLSGVLDTTTSRFLHPDDSLMMSRMEFLRQHRLSVFTEPWTRGQSENRLDAEIRDMRRVSSARPGVFMRGKLKGMEGVAIPKVIVVVDADTVIGFLKTRGRPRGCFSGYMRGAAGRRFELYGLQ